MRRAAAAALLAAVVLVAGCGGDSGGAADRDAARLRAADAALGAHPRDARAMEHVMRVAYEAAGTRQDTGSGRYTAAARPYLNRAAAVWPQYLEATRGRPGVPFASLMVQVFGQGLDRPADAADAARRVALAKPTVASYLQLVAWSARARDVKEARAAGRKAVQLSVAGDRADVRSRVRALIAQAG
ncbi:MAG: hypothetical protein QOJ12_39 [Thermoleophilales bacterium]|nr:hypothetical protein [Thermoleophilales bacterium]